jgi:hypothetical protein
MKQKVTIKSQAGKIIFKGAVLYIPIKKAAIIKRSIELFDDDDPCIIHQSFVVKTLADELIQVLSGYPQEICLNAIKEDLSYLDVPVDAICSLGV